jgi:FeS assembly SUF system protein
MNNMTHLGMGKLNPEINPLNEVKDDLSLPLQERVVNVLKSIYDPEIPVDIYELGLIYLIDTTPAGEVKVNMTLTSPACPVAGSLPGQVQDRIAALPGVKSAKVELVWDPPWSQERMSESAKLELGFF